MQQLDDSTLLSPRELKLTTVKGTFTGPLYIRVENSTVTCRRDIDTQWTDVPARSNINLEEIMQSTTAWLKYGPPIDMDGRVIPLSLS